MNKCKNYQKCVWNNSHITNDLSVYNLTTFEVEEANVSIFMSRHNNWECRMANDLVDLRSRRAVYKLNSRRLLKTRVHQNESVPVTPRNTNTRLAILP